MEEGHLPSAWEGCEEGLLSLMGSVCDRLQLVRASTGLYSSVVAHQRLGDS